MIFIVGQAVGFAVALIKIWNDSEVKMARMEEKIKVAEDKDETLFKKLDHISVQLTELSIQLSNKQDK
jgi:uncharacterized membrane protein YciS (DUF1049 family)